MERTGHAERVISSMQAAYGMLLWSLLSLLLQQLLQQLLLLLFFVAQHFGTCCDLPSLVVVCLVACWLVVWLFVLVFLCVGFVVVLVRTSVLSPPPLLYVVMVSDWSPTSFCGDRAAVGVWPRSVEYRRCSVVPYLACLASMASPAYTWASRWSCGVEGTPLCTI